MSRTQRFLGRGLLLGVLVWLLVACGTGTVASPPLPATPASSVSIVQTLEQDLNQGNAKQALELFAEDAVVMVVNPSPNTIDQTSGYIIIDSYYIPRAYSAAAEITYYRGQEQINTYLANLVDHQFQSNDSLYQEDEEGVTWVCQAGSQIYFKASIQDGKITNLRVTFF